MKPLSELFAALDKAIAEKDAADKKLAEAENRKAGLVAKAQAELDRANSSPEVEVAARELSEKLQVARELQQEFTRRTSGLLETSPTRVRQS